MLFPISPLVDMLPKWWKSIPKEVPVEAFPIGMSTIKRCPGFKDLFRNSMCIPAWSQYRLFQDPQHGFSHIAPNSITGGQQHREEQLAGAFPNYQHYKLLSPWMLKEKTGVSFVVNQASWHNADPCQFHIPAGSLEFKYQHSTHINLVSPKQQILREINIEAGQPLVYLTPMSEKDVTIAIHVVNEFEHNKLKTYHHSFHNSYELTRKILKDKK
jgi:hypothetical protein